MREKTRQEKMDVFSGMASTTRMPYTIRTAFGIKYTDDLLKCAFIN